MVHKTSDAKKIKINFKIKRIRKKYSENGWYELYKYLVQGSSYNSKSL